MVQKLKADIGNVICEALQRWCDVEEGLKGFCEEIQQRLQIIAGYRVRSCKFKGSENLSGMWTNLLTEVWHFVHSVVLHVLNLNRQKRKNAAETDGTRWKLPRRGMPERENTEEHIECC